MKQPEVRGNGKPNLFPELAPGISIVYREGNIAGKHKTVERRLTIRLYNGKLNRLTIHMTRDNYKERYQEAVERLIGFDAITRAYADKYDGIPSWSTILSRFGLVERMVPTYLIEKPEGWIDPQLNSAFRSEHRAFTRKRKPMPKARKPKL